jgi:hypothetical protein
MMNEAQNKEIIEIDHQFFVFVYVENGTKFTIFYVLKTFD